MIYAGFITQRHFGIFSSNKNKKKPNIKFMIFIWKESIEKEKFIY